GAAGVRAGGIDSYDADRPFPLAIFTRQLVDQRALPRSGSAGKTDQARATGMVKKRLEQLTRFPAIVLNGADGARQGAHVAGANTVDPGLERGWHFSFACPPALKSLNPMQRHPELRQ